MGRLCVDDHLCIQLARTELREAYNAADADRILQLYSASVFDFSHSQPTFSRDEARAVLRAKLTALFAQYEVRCAPAAIQILVLGATAIDYGWFELALTPRVHGTTHRQRTRYVHVWKKEADGAWRIALTIDNPDHAPMLADLWIASLRSGVAAEVAG